MKVLIEPADWASRQADLLRIRFAVFVDEQGVPAELEHDEYDRQALHLIATPPGGTPVATARMLPDGHIGRMAVLPGWRKKGIGTAMLRDLIGLAAERGISDLFLNAQCEAESFYRRLGFKPEGDIFRDAGIDHRRMTLKLGPDER